MGLRVDVDEVHAAGTGMAQVVEAPVTLAGISVGPSAADQVSATVAAGLSVRLQTIGAHTVRAAQITTAAAGALHANAATYREQEDLNTAALRPGGGASVSAPAGIAPTASPASAVLPPLAMPPTGVTPTDGKAVAVLIHGGTGPGPLLQAATEARAHAERLRDISTHLRGTSVRLSRVWQSPAADAAVGRITTLAGWYDTHAEHALSAARACQAQADSFGQARAAVPRPEVFDDLERRLAAASRANSVARGAYTPVIAELQTRLAATHAKALTAYADYATRAADLGADTPTPPPSTVHALDNHTVKDAPPDPPPRPPSRDPLPGWTEEQKQEVAVEIAHNHSGPKHEGDFPPDWSEADIARWIYQTMNDPSTQVATNIDSGATMLLRDGKVIYINPNVNPDKSGDYGTVFAPTPLPGSSWQTPQEYFDHVKAPLEPLPPPPPGRFPPVGPGDMSPHLPEPAVSPPLSGRAGVAGVSGQGQISGALSGIPLPGEGTSGTLPDWGTHISPGQIDPDAGDEIANLEKFLEAFRPPPPPTA